MTNPIREWNRDFRLVAIAVAAQGIFFGVQLTLFKNFIWERLSIEAHELGYVESLREVPGFMNAFFIALMIRFAPPILAGISMAIMGLGVMAYTEVTSVFSLAAYSLAWSIGFHCWLPLQKSMALTFSPEGQKGKWLGQLRSVSSVSWLFSILICKLSFDFLDYDGLYVMAGVASILGGVAVSFASRKRVEVGRGLVFKRRYGLYYSLEVLQGLRRQMFTTFAIYALVKEYGMSVQTTMLLVLINQTLSTLTAPLMGRMVDRYGERMVMSLSYIGLIGVFLGYASIPYRSVLYVLYCIDNMIFIGDIALTTYIHKITPDKELQPTLAMGVTMNHVAAVGAPLVGGLAWHYFGYEIVIFSGAAVAAVSLILSQRVDPEGLMAREQEQIAAAGKVAESAT